MNTQDFEMILDSLQTTGVYVVREDNHRILYYNKRVKEVFPHVQTGVACQEVWQEYCSNCPLLHMEGKEENRTVSHKSPFGGVVDVVSKRILWEESTPAFLITITPHAEAASYTYSKILRVNLTKDSYEVVKESAEEREIESDGGNLSALSDYFMGAGNIYRNDQKRFREFISLDNLRQQMKEKKMAVCTYRRKWGEGFRWHTMEVLPAYDYTDRNQNVMLYVKDVHDIYRKGIELDEFSIRNQEVIQALVDLNFGIYIIDLHNGTINPVRVSGDVDKLFQKGIRQWDSVLDRMMSFFHEEYKEELWEKFSLGALRDSAARGENEIEFLCLRDMSGEYHYVSLTAHFYETEGDNSHVVIAIQDVDERTRQEIRRSQDDRRMSVIIRSMSSLFFATYYMDMETDTFQAITEREEVGKILGEETSANKALDNYAENFVHPDDREEFFSVMNENNFRENLRRTHPFLAVEYRLIEKNEKGFSITGWVRGTIILAEETNGRPARVLYVVQDVTESKEKQEREKRALKEACDAAIHANASKSEFLSRMSHDIRTPMNAIIGMTSIAGSHLDNRERVEDCLNKINVSSRHLLSLINEVLDMSKIESGKIDLAEEEFNLSDLIENLLTMIRPTTKAKEQKLELHITGVKHEDVIGDVLRLQQVFMNILGNAVKYTPEGGRLQLTISEKPSDVYGYGCYEFIFEDNGIGMSEEFVKKIFEPFSRAEDSRVSRIEGTGLGMTIALNIVHMMNGNIQVDSREGEGSRFTVTVFLRQQSGEALSLEHFANLPVLVVDDEQYACETTCALLEEMGMRAEWVQSGAEALPRIRGAHQSGDDYFAIILDWKMPGMDGIQTAKKIRSEIDEDIPIIILSAYDWSSIEAEARQAGISEFISKPLFQSRLVYLFKKILEGDAEAEAEAPGKAPEQEFEDARILLAEDNDLNREIAEEIIGDTGITVESAVDGKQALEMYRERGAGYYDMILMDIQMPVMNGYEATRAIRASGQEDATDIPIVAMTANAFMEDVIASREAGMNEHITKPLDMGQLMNCLRSWVKKQGEVSDETERGK